MLSEIYNIRWNFDDDILKMQMQVGLATTPADSIDRKESLALWSEFGNMYYELLAFSDINKISLSPVIDQIALMSKHMNQTCLTGNVSNYQLPIRKFSTFSGIITE